MSFFNRCLLFWLVFSLASCGFRPLYTVVDKNVIIQEFGKIRLKPIENRVGQIVHNLLLDRLSPNGHSIDPEYTLDVWVSVSKQEMGLKFTNEATRATFTLVAEYSLTNNGDGRVLKSGGVRSVNSYNISDSEFSRIASENDAMKRAARQVSDEIKTHLGLYFAQQGT